MSIGDTKEGDHIKALDRLAFGHKAALGTNHVLPVIDKISISDMTFYVFPLMSLGFSTPWYFSFSEVLDACEQIMEVYPIISLLIFSHAS